MRCFPLPRQPRRVCGATLIMWKSLPSLSPATPTSERLIVVNPLRLRLFACNCASRNCSQRARATSAFMCRGLRQRERDYAVQWMKCVQSPAWKRDQEREAERDSCGVCVRVCVRVSVFVCVTLGCECHFELRTHSLFFLFRGECEVIMDSPRFTRFIWSSRIRCLD